MARIISVITLKSCMFTAAGFIIAATISGVIPSAGPLVVGRGALGSAFVEFEAVPGAAVGMNRPSGPHGAPAASTSPFLEDSILMSPTGITTGGQGANHQDNWKQNPV